MAGEKEQHMEGQELIFLMDSIFFPSSLALYPICGLCVLREMSSRGDGAGKSNKNDERARKPAFEKVPGEFGTGEDGPGVALTMASVSAKGQKMSEAQKTHPHPGGSEWKQTSEYFEIASFKALLAFLPFHPADAVLTPPESKSSTDRRWPPGRYLYHVWATGFGFHQQK